jgi:hypothetical protein
MLNFVKMLFKKKRKTNLDDEARQASIQSRKQNSELKAVRHEIELMKLEREKLLNQAKLNALEEKLFGSDEGSAEEQMLMSVLLPMLQKQNPAMSEILKGQIPTPVVNTSNNPSPAMSTTGVSLSEDMLKAYISKIPKHLLKKLKKLNDEELRVKIIETIPDLSKDSVDKAIVIIRS